MRCYSCNEDYFYEDMRGPDSSYYKHCRPQHKEAELAMIRRNKEIGHTADDVCGCSMCAAQFDMR